MGTDSFAGRAQAYAAARTGKFTALLVANGSMVYAVEPDADMRAQLAATLADFPNAKVIAGSAEETALPDHSVDVIVCAQALNWFDIEAFRAECLRISKMAHPLVLALYNDERVNGHSAARYAKSTGALYHNPVVRTFPNPTFFTRERWRLYHASMAGVPQEGEEGYDAYFKELDKAFAFESEAGMLRLDLIRVVYSEQL